jgi:predicted acetyltransferase
MFLATPDPAYAGAFGRLVDDYRRAGEPTRVAKYAAGEGAFRAYVESLRLAERGIDLPADKVPYHTYWLVDGGEIVGVVRVRPRLTPRAEIYDGHVGYDVPPSHRNKGYGSALLRLALVEARRLGLARVIVTCAAGNAASRRVIERCGGRLLGEVTDDDSGERLNRYELNTPDPDPGRPSPAG